MILRQILLLALLLLVAATTSAAELPQSWWQLVFRYDQTGLRLEQAEPFAITGKTPTSPGLTGAPVRLNYSVAWLDDSGAELARTAMVMPLGVRSTLQGEEPCVERIPDDGFIVVRTLGPAAGSGCSAVTLTVAGTAPKRRPDLAVPSAFEYASLTLPLPSRSLRPADGPVGSVKLRDTGPDQNRLVIVIMGDGYTAANLAAGAFTSQTNYVLSVFDMISPWDILGSGTNVYRIDVQSNQQGADMDPYGTYKDTYFDCSYWIADIERLLCVTNDGYSRAIAAADTHVGVGLWDQIIVLVNSSKYGGSGGGISVASVHPDGPLIVLHEFGHSFAQLADEYTGLYVAASSSGDDPGPNVDYDSAGPGLQWLPWVMPTTPLPTPTVYPYISRIGTFEGANYQPTGVYRPAFNCLMKALNAPFDSVCQEAHLTRYFAITSMIDAAVPLAGSVSPVPPAGRTFAVTPHPWGNLTYQWQLDDSVVADSVGPSFSLSLQQLTDHGLRPDNRLKLHVTYHSIRMRLSEPSDDYEWTLQPDCNSNGVDDSVDLAVHTSWDLNQNGLPDDCDGFICCEGSTGNINTVGIIDLADLSLLIAYLTANPRPPLPCPDEANVNAIGIIDLSDLSMLIAYLTLSPPPALPNCP